MAGRLEKLDKNNWREITGAPMGVVMLGKSDCDACNAWTKELEAFLEQDTEFTDVRFGKAVLDEGGLADFKRANIWIADVDELPFHAIFVNGKRAKTFAGGGVDRLTTRLKNLRESPPA